MTHSISYSDNWEFADWKKFQKVLFRLQRRIFKAVRDGDKAKAKRLQKLVLSSRSARMLAIRQVTQLNTGKKTAGIDGKKSLTFKERFQLEETLKLDTKTWKHQGLREIPIPKKDGTKRILKVPTIADRAWQCLLKYALEPAHEATFHAHSYGFRPGRGTHDAQKKLFMNLRSSSNGIRKRVLEIDIEKCFDRISHKAILDRVIAPEFIIGGLRRCLKSGINPQFPSQGTPQGGVCSPLLANIALNGIEKIGEYKLNGRNIPKCIRTDNFKAFRQKVKHIVNNSNYGAETKVSKLAPVVRGWRNYHKYCKMEGSRFNLWHLANRTFKVFLKQKTINRYQAEKMVKTAFPSVKHSENKFVQVKGEKSPYDGDINYWSKRNSALYDGATAKTLRKQSHSCGYCKLKFLDGEKVELHHIDGNHNNWDEKNLLAIHRSCHQYKHMSQNHKD